MESHVSLRTVVALNKNYETGKLLNALGHTVLGLGASSLRGRDLDIQDYRDAEGNSYPHISYHPVIVLKSDNGGKLRRFAEEVRAADLPVVIFVHTMFDGGTPVQLATTAKTNADDLDYVAVATFGAEDILRPLTKRFRIFALHPWYGRSSPDHGRVISGFLGVNKS